MFDDDAMEEIRQVFLEESYEGLDIMESGLLNLEPGAAEPETINDIFRAAHSIKGGGGTFGFSEVSHFTHGVETILDQMRDGSREVTDSAVQLLLETVDCLRGMMDCIRDGQAYDQERIDGLQQRIDQMLAGEDASAAPAVAQPEVPAPAPASAEPKIEARSGPSKAIWTIDFKPHKGMLQRANEPSLIFRALAELGELEVTADSSNRPNFEDWDPEECFLSWQLKLTTEAGREEIAELFEWVEDDCDLSIVKTKTLSEAPTPAPQAQAVVEEKAKDTAPQLEVVPAPDRREKQDRRQDDRRQEERREQSRRAEDNKPAAKDSGSIRVDIDKIDVLLNLVGELVITQSMLGRFSKDFNEQDMADLRDGLAQLERNARELQESAMQIRMLPIKSSFSRFKRLVRDLGLSLNKKVNLELHGEQTELDKTVLEKISDPLVHLVRNSMDHGIEKPEVRVAAGKPRYGTLTLSARHEAGNIVIAVSDDGAGLNQEKILKKARDRGLINDDENLTEERIFNLLFLPGFSTADQVSDVSGRGVGMDVVRRNIQDLGGRIDVQSEQGKGSTFTIRLPLTLAIMDGQLVRVGPDYFVIPLLSIVESVLIDRNRLNLIANETLVYRLRHEFIPVVEVSKACNIQSNDSDPNGSLANKLLVVVESGGQQYGLVVDDLCEQQQVVIKALEANYKQVYGLSGATILGDGTVALILDIPGLVQRCFLERDEPELELATA